MYVIDKSVEQTGRASHLNLLDVVSLVSQSCMLYLPLSCLSMSMSMSLVGASLIAREIFEDHSTKKNNKKKKKV